MLARMAQWLNNLSPRMVNAFIAVEINEVIEFVRFPIVIATTPRMTAYLREKKYIK